MIVAVIALVLAVTGAAVAAPTLLKLSRSKVVKIADKEIDTKAPTLSVATAANANQLGGKTLAQLSPVLAGERDSTPVSLPNTNAGADVVSVSFTLTATSRVNVSSSTELEGAEIDERGQCVARLDGSQISPNFETTFDDIGTNNEAVVAVDGSKADVPAGAHKVTISCNTISGTINKEDSSANVIAVPNP